MHPSCDVTLSWEIFWSHPYPIYNPASQPQPMNWLCLGQYFCLGWVTELMLLRVAKILLGVAKFGIFLGISLGTFVWGFVRGFLGDEPNVVCSWGLGYIARRWNFGRNCLAYRCVSIKTSYLHRTFSKCEDWKMVQLVRRFNRCSSGLWGSKLGVRVPYSLNLLYRFWF